MQYVPLSLDEAIERIYARTNSETYCILEAVAEGEKPVTLYPKGEFDEQRIRSLCESAALLPGRMVLLHVHDPNGSRTKPNCIYLITDSTTEMPNMTSKYNQAQQPANNTPSFTSSYAGLNPQQLGLDPLALVLLDNKEKEIHNLRELNVDLKDQVKAQQTEIKELKDKNFDLERENRFKDREHEIEAKAAAAAQQGGLNGIANNLLSTPEGMQLIMGLAGKFLGGSAAAPMGALPAGQANDPKAGAIQEIAAWLNTQSEETVSQFYAIMHYAAQNQINLSQIISNVQNG